MDKQNIYNDHGYFNFDIEHSKSNCVVSNNLMMHFIKFLWGNKNTWLEIKAKDDEA